MSRLIFRVAIALLAFMVGVVCVAFWIVYHKITYPTEPADIAPLTSQVEPVPEEPILISMCKLNEYPESCWNKMIRVRAILWVDKVRLDSGMYEALDLSETGCGKEPVWMSIGFETGNASARWYDIEKVEHLKFDESLNRLLGGEIRRPLVAEVEVIGRFRSAENDPHELVLTFNELVSAQLLKSSSIKRPKRKLSPC